MRFISWVPAEEDVIALAFRLVARNGVSRMQIADPANDPERLKRLAATRAARGLLGGGGRAHLLDQPGAHARLLRRARRGARRLRRHRPPLPEGSRAGCSPRTPCASSRRTSWRPRATRRVELHSHCTIGLAPLVYLEGVAPGFHAVHTANGPLARGTSQPETVNTVRNLEAAGFAHALDLEAQAAVAEHFGAARPGEGAAGRGAAGVRRPVLPPPAAGRHGHDHAADARASCGRPELFDAVLEEVTRVRAEMGYPIIVTPVSQFVASQAARNVIDGERWANVSDETIRYFLGHYGEPVAPVDPDVADRVLSRPQAERCASCGRSRSTARASASGAGSPRRSCSSG